MVAVTAVTVRLCRLWSHWHGERLEGRAARLIVGQSYCHGSDSCNCAVRGATRMMAGWWQQSSYKNESIHAIDDCIHSRMVAGDSRAQGSRAGPSALFKTVVPGCFCRSLAGFVGVSMHQFVGFCSQLLMLFFGWILFIISVHSFIRLIPK